MEKIVDDDLNIVVGGVGENKVTEMNGIVKEVLPNDRYKVQLDNGNIITVGRSAKLRVNFVNIACGNQVTVELRPFDSSHGRIIWQSK